MKHICQFLFVVIISSFCISASIPKTQENECEFKGKKLYGKVRFVEHSSQADVKIKIVNNFPDLKVKLVENFPNDCGEWKVVEYGEDLKVYVTESFPDLKVKFVENYPGIKK